MAAMRRVVHHLLEQETMPFESVAIRRVRQHDLREKLQQRRRVIDRGQMLPSVSRQDVENHPSAVASALGAVKLVEAVFIKLGGPPCSADTPSPFTTRAPRSAASRKSSPNRNT